MTEIIQKKLNDSPLARWSVLAIVSLTMLCGYFLTDAMAPMKSLLESELGWSSSAYGFFTSAYSWFNVFLFMLVISGVILDKKGARFTGILACILMIIGCSLKYYAISEYFTMTGDLFGWPARVMVAAIGYAIFGVGVETAGITVTKIIARWFKGYEIALAMGLQVAVARIGTTIALSVTVPIAMYFHSLSAPILFALILLCIGFISFLVFTVADRRLDTSIKESGSSEEAFRINDIFSIIKNKGFWLIALLCVLFYSAVFPFLKYATDLMVNKYNVSIDLAGNIPAMLPFGTMLLTPFFGGLYDKKGRGASIMILGAILLIVVHLLFAMPFMNVWWFAALIMIILGIAFSLVPSAMWPSVPKIIPQRQLGTAYALIFWVQNIGLGGVPLLIGWVLEKYCQTGNPDTPYDYTLPMLIFAGFGVLALLVALTLKAEDKKKGYGLEQPNIQK